MEEGCRKAHGGQGETFTIISSDSNLLQMITRTRQQQPQNRDPTTVMTGQPTKQIIMAKTSTRAQEHEDDGTTQHPMRTFS